MIIGHYAPSLWASGGIATYVRRLGHAQASAGHTVIYLSRTLGDDEASRPKDAANLCIVADDEDLFRQARHLSLDVLHLHKPVRALPADRVPTVRTMHGNQGSCPSGTRYLSRQDAPCNRAYSIPGCLWGHVVDRCGSRHPRNVRASFESITTEMHLASALHTFTVSQFLHDQMVRSGCPPDRLHTLHSPAPSVSEPCEPPPREGIPRFVFLGRLVPQKGLAWLLRALARVRVRVHLEVAGDGHQRDELVQLAADLGVADRVTFHGWVAPPVVKRLIASARAVVFPSVWHEPAGLVTLEAAAYGRPVLASRVGGIPEYAAAEHAFLADPNDVDTLAHQIERLAEDWTLAAQMGQNGQHLARTRFSMESFLNKLERLYALAADQSVAGVLTAHREA